ncbi:MAG: hypothetical protein LBL72_01810, partial [Candidatus Accumulibacter sp.]|nr:hypothetical protein [Accumulibacter sp.]
MTDNTLNIEGGAKVTGDAVGAHSDSGDAQNNRVVISGSTTQIVGAAIGGLLYTSGTGVVENNTVTMTAGTVGEIYGGMNESTSYTDANSNHVILEGGNVTSDVYGAMTDGAANSNTVTIRGTGNVGHSVYGGSGDTSANWNTVIIEAGYTGTVSGYVFGGDADGGAANNTVEINGGTVDGVSGAYSFSGAATKNIVTLNGGVVSDIVTGGKSESSTATGNIVNVNGGTVGGVIGGESGGSDAVSDNIVNLNGGTVNSKVYGGYSQAGTATHNTVNLNGSTVNTFVYGGYVNNTSGSATGNTVNLNGVMTAGTGLYGGACNGACTGDVFTGNTLNVRAVGNTVAGIENFEKINFYLDSTVVANDVILTVGTATLGNGVDPSKIDVGMSGSSSSLTTGDEVTLIHATTSLSGLWTHATGQAGSTLNYNFNLHQNGNDLMATVTSVGASQQSKSLPEGHLSGTSFL